MIRLRPSLRPGDRAPGFSLPDAQGKAWSLEDFKGSWLVIFFYPADFTDGCTAESCAFRDAYVDFKAEGAALLGVSGDSRESHGAFGAMHGLPYTLLSDRDAYMRRAYTVPHVLGRLSGRTSFVVDPSGVIRSVFDSRAQALDHVSVSLQAIRKAKAS
jgi:peroxiredoxin Q/BCP